MFVLIFGTLLLSNLGHNYLWDDEAHTALYGEAVWRTGDTNSVVGHNLIAFGNGLELLDLKNRVFAPLSFYVEAPFIGPFGRSTLAARLPFALFGLLSVLLVLYWLRKDNAGLRTWILVGLGTCGNVSLILYTRQARYYALVTFLTLLVTYLYVHWNGSRRTLAGLSAGGLALLATHNLSYAGLGLSLGVDYLLYGRRRRPFGPPELASLVGSQALVGGLILWIWNPLRSPANAYRSVNWIADRVILWWYNIRDLNACEFGVGLLLVAAPILYFLTKRQNPWLVRLPIGIATYNIAVSAFSPQAAGWYSFADVRYMQATIPALVFLGVATLESLPLPQDWPRYLGALLLFFTNFFNIAAMTVVGGPSGTGTDGSVGGPPRSTLAAFVGELEHPLPSPYGAASEWIDQNVAPEQSIFVLPDYATSPLVFHSPQAVYAWQLDASQQSKYPTLPAIHFKGAALPDYIIVFGYNIAAGRGLVDSLASQGVQYVPHAYLPAHWPDVTRPELFWHSFVPVPVGNPNLDGVFIFQRA